MTSIPSTTVCEFCGKKHTPPKGYETRKRYCSDRCRYKAKSKAIESRLKDKSPPRPCEFCGTEYQSRRKKRKYCSRECAASAYNRRRVKSTGKNEARREKTSSQSPKQVKKSPENRATKVSVVKREKAAVLKPQDTIYSKGTFTDAEFKAALKAIEDELKAQGKPLYQMTAEQAREKSRREVMRGER